MTTAFNLDIPKMGYIILYRHKTGMIGDFIRKMQLQRGFSEEAAGFTHVEISGGGQWSVCVEPPKTNIVDITKKYKGRFIRVVRFKQPLNMDDRTYWRKLAKVAFWSATKNNICYDFLGVMSFVLGFIHHSKNRYFCSENAIWSLKQEFDKPLGVLTDNKVMPAHFYDFDFIWEGYVTILRQ